ncbi:MAG TPA: hypothetical protein VKY81_00340 [Natronosporangium sp.]|nr:hypothetical protein [Natronosporangium sp.]
MLAEADLAMERHSWKLASVAILIAALASCTSDTTESSDGGHSLSPPGSAPAAPGRPSESRNVQPDEEAGIDRSYLAMARCLRDKGWDAYATEEGWGASGIPHAQSDQYDADENECRTSTGIGEVPPPEITEEEAAELYDVLLGVADCMRDLGFAVSEPPSRQAFVEDVVTTTIPDWHPYDVVFESGNQSDIQLVESECPVE